KDRQRLRTVTLSLVPKCEGPGAPRVQWRRSCRTTTSYCGLFGFSAGGVDVPGYADADEVEGEHGNGVDAHGPRIGTGADDGGNDKDGEDGVANVLPEEPGADNAEHGEEEDEDGEFEADAEAEDDGEEEAAVVLDGDHGREVVSHVDDE